MIIKYDIKLLNQCIILKRIVKEIKILNQQISCEIIVKYKIIELLN